MHAAEQNWGAACPSSVTSDNDNDRRESESRAEKSENDTAMLGPVRLNKAGALTGVGGQMHTRRWEGLR